MTFVYFAHMIGKSTSEDFYKIGWSYNSKIRFRDSVRKNHESTSDLKSVIENYLSDSISDADFPYDVKLEHEIECWCHEEAEVWERKLLTLAKQRPHRPQRPMSGYTECFLADDAMINTIIENMNTLLSDWQTNGPD